MKRVSADYKINEVPYLKDMKEEVVFTWQTTTLRTNISDTFYESGPRWPAMFFFTRNTGIM